MIHMIHKGRWARALRRGRRGVGLIELGLAGPFILVPMLVAISGFGQNSTESSGVARGLNDAAGIWAQGYIKNPPTGTATTDAATDESIRQAALNAFLAASGTGATQVYMHFLRVSYNTTTSTTTVSDAKEGTLTGITSANYKYGVSNGVVQTQTPMTLQTTDRGFVVEVWFRHPGILGPFSSSGIAYGNRFLIR